MTGQRSGGAQAKAPVADARTEEARPGRKPAAEQAYDTIRDQILSGRLPPGARLTEQGLAEALGLSRTPVRAAITRLLHEGFAERGDGYSTRVSAVPEDEIAHIFEIRRRLEALAAERAALRATPSHIEALLRLSEEMDALTPPQTDEAYARISAINTEFHRIVAEAAGAPRLTAVLALAVDIGIVARTYRNYSDADLIRSARHHRELVDAITARSPDWAAHVMSSHVLAAAHAASTPPKAREPV